MKKTLPFYSIFICCLLISLNNFSQTQVNLALNQPSYASSVRTALPDNAFDGLTSTRWESDYSDPQWIYVDLGGSYSIKRIFIQWDTAYAVDYVLQVSDDADNWITIRSINGNNILTNDFTDLNANGRYVRILGAQRGNSSSGQLYGYFLSEMEVYGPDDAPAVSITSPENNTQHIYTTTPGWVATAQATGMAGKDIEKVELFSGSMLIAMDMDAPYSFDLSGLDEGIHVLTARATDEENAVAFSSPIVLRLSSVTPDPCSSAAWNSNTTYSEAGNQVTYLGQLYKNRWYTVGQDPFKNSGAYKVWELVSTCSTPTTVNITQPNQNDTYRALASIDIHVDALATAPYRITKVDLFSGSTLIDSDTSASFSFKWNDVLAGSYTLTAVATDNAGVTTTSAAQTVHVVAGSGCNAPEWRSNIVYGSAGEQVTYQGALYKNSWYSHGQNPASNSGPYQVWTLLSSCPATATITSPGDSAIYTAPATIAINATASNPSGGVTKLEFYQGVSLLAVDSTAPYSYNWTGLSAGTYLISAKAYGPTGVAATSQTVTIIVNELQGVFTWTGAGGDNSWNNPTNWSPNGVPGNNDSVTIGGALGYPMLSNNTTITDLTLLSDSIDLNGQQLMVNGIVRFSGGKITNGLLNVQCSDVWFTGTVFDPTVTMTVTCSNIYLNGSTFNGSSTITKQGNEAVDNESTGGNIFNGPVTIVNNTIFSLKTNSATGDDFNAAVTFNNNNTGYMEINATGTSTFAGNITINSNTAVNIGGTVLLDSSSDQMIRKTGIADIVFNKLEVNKIGSALVTLSDPVRISTAMTFVNGNIASASDSRLIFQSGSIMTGASFRSFVSGPVTRYGTGAFTFPIGREGRYRPVGIAPTGAASEAFTAEYFREQGPDIQAIEPTIHHLSGCEYWTVDRTFGATATTVTLSWDTSSCGVNAPGELLVARWNGSLWINEGNGGITGNSTAGTVRTLNAINAFSPFTLGSFTANNVLPVTLLDFVARKDQNRVKLTWTTTAEYQNRGFVVQRSSNRIQFEDISFVEGAGNSNTTQFYSSYDNNPAHGISYYRLKQLDIDGKASYSEIASVEWLPNDAIRLMPNPAVHYTEVVLALSNREHCVVTLSDMTGRILQTHHLTAVGSQTLRLDLLGYVSGTYLLTVSAADRIVYRNKILKK